MWSKGGGELNGFAQLPTHAKRGRQIRGEENPEAPTYDDDGVTVKGHDRLLLA
jgi:hypothetical protein